MFHGHTSHGMNKHQYPNMKFEQDKPIETTETADEYGRRENCFRSHIRHPFTFQSYIADLQSTKETTEIDGLVAQPGVKAGVLPNPKVTGDVFEQHRKNVEKFLQDSPSTFSPPGPSALTKELLIPVDELDLGSCLDNDLQEYLRPVWLKRYRNTFEQWLPLACTRSEKDEGLDFPPGLNRLWALLHREIEADNPFMSDAAANLVREQNRSLTASEYQDLLVQQRKFEHYQYSCLDPISPPLSPVSDDIAPFVPDGGVAVIDLVSEPNSPNQAAIEVIQRDIDSEPVISSTLMTSSPSRELPQLFQTRHTIIQEAKADVPIVLTSSDAPSEENVLTNICLPLIGDVDEEASNLLEERGHFEDAFMTLLDDRRYYANSLVSQERFDPADSISRIPVPLLDFDIQPPEWSIQRSTAKTQFAFLRKSMPSIFNALPIPRDARSEISLRWSVFPLEKGQPIMKDELKVPDDTMAQYISQDPGSNLSSIHFVSIKPDLDVLCIIEDEEIEEAYLTDDMVDETPSAIIQHQESPVRMNSMHGNKSTYFPNPDCSDLSRPPRRKLDDETIRLLPNSYDTRATSILLHNFMELKGIKRPRIDTEYTTGRQPTDRFSSKSINEPPSRNDREGLPSIVVEEMAPAPAPQFEVSPQKACFIISVNLARPIVRRLEEVWSPENLIDMDYSRHNATTWLPGAAPPKEVISELSFEADISLSASTGIIMTNILKVRQRPLPGSQSQAPLRERVQKVSQRYETLIVLVSESNASGEFLGALAPPDAAAYADFLAFTVALEGDVNVHLIPGAEETMASWVLAFVARHSHPSESLKRFLSSEETPWEIFLRRAGTNVIGAKVLSKTLFEQAGVSGLALFLMMPVQERIARYGQILGGGGEKVLRRMGKVMDCRWAH
ncbi:hypothetical protein V8C37DRAFT_379172 [Trichoderma ceciliae]